MGPTKSLTFSSVFPKGCHENTTPSYVFAAEKSSLLGPATTELVDVVGALNDQIDVEGHGPKKGIVVNLCERFPK